MTDATRPRASDDLLATACDIIEKTQHIVDENGTVAWLGLLRSCALDLRDARAEVERLWDVARAAKAYDDANIAVANGEDADLGTAAFLLREALRVAEAAKGKP